MDDQLEDFKKTFFEESADLLGMAEMHLMDLSITEPSAESLGAIFRSVHSIKGGAGAFGMERLVKFTHSFESVLDALRSGKISIDKSRHDLLMKGFDVVSDLVREAKGDVQLPADREAAVLAGLNDWWPQEGGHGGGNGAGAAKAAAPVKKIQKFIIRFKPLRTLYAKANEPLLILRQIKNLGNAIIACTTGGIPTLDRFDPEEAYIGWIIQIETDIGEAALMEVFEFVDVDSELSIQLQPDGPQTIDTPFAASAPAISQETHQDVAKTTQAPSPAKEAVKEKEGGEKTAAVTSIRVDLDKIDRLVNMVGEIVITQAMVAEQLKQLDIENKNLMNGLESMQQHTRELQDSVMSIRAQPVKSVFQRMPRLVRELAGTLNKDVRLVTSGENTEVDKTVIEQLSDPLTHMIRNSVDHGIEMPDKREAAGKPREGTILLSAEHRSGRIVIQIVDDGGGINRERVKQKCIEKGLINPDAQLTDEEIDNFIFLPGFSTAEKISNVSGRGVGMDVVKKNIQALGGRVNVVNKPGLGSRFVLSLPLTLAVLDGMVVTVGQERYVLPLTSIIELLRPTPEMISKLITHGDLIHIRGEYIRLLYVHDVFNIRDAITNPADALVVLVEVDGGQKVGLVVDEVIGQQQVVIKSLESNYRQIEGVSAATILGDGRVALILDVIGLRQILLDRAVTKNPAHTLEAAL
ncbi:MAG: chemotaxis protein CheA [Alphaproteobacteria bacterium]|nr:chemotaxis protein CheA [Alphaproteobacteria bacterium]